MNKVLVSLLILFVSLPLVFSCGRGQQSLQDEAICWAEQQIQHVQLSSSLDSAYWIGICWNMYQLSKDSAFRIEAERYLEPLSRIYEDRNWNADKAFRAYMFFGKGYDATGNNKYRHKVWDVADCLMTDTTCINASTVEVLLWGTAHGGCHCFEEAAISWGRHQLESFTELSAKTFQSMRILFLYTKDTLYLQTFKAFDKKPTLFNASDSLRQALAYVSFDPLVSDHKYDDKITNLLKKLPLKASTSLEEGYYFTEILLGLSENKIMY